MKEEYQKQLNELIEKIKKDGFIISSNFEVIDPNKKIYVIEEYWRSDGAYESEGRRREQSYIYEINQQNFEKLYAYFTMFSKKFNSELDDESVQYFLNLFEGESNIELGNYDVTYAEEGDQYLSRLNKIEITNDKIILNFGEEYRESFGGYIEIKKVDNKYLNDFETIDVNTY